jgi:hypothetical protein
MEGLRRPGGRVQALRRPPCDPQAVEHLLHLSDCGNEEAKRALLHLNLKALLSRLFGNSPEIPLSVLEALNKGENPLSGTLILHLNPGETFREEIAGEKGTEIYGIRIPSGSAFRIFNEDQMAGILLSSETEIHDTLYPGGTEIEVTPEGRVHHAILKSPALIRGIPCADSELIFFHEDGSIKHAVLSAPHLIGEFIFPSGTAVEFDENGKLIHPEKKDPERGPKGSGPAALTIAGLGAGLATLLADSSAHAALNAVAESNPHEGLGGLLLSLWIGLGVLATLKGKGGGDRGEKDSNLHHANPEPLLFHSRYMGISKVI